MLFIINLFQINTRWTRVISKTIPNRLTVTNIWPPVSIRLTQGSQSDVLDLTSQQPGFTIAQVLSTVSSYRCWESSEVLGTMQKKNDHDRMRYSVRDMVGSTATGSSRGRATKSGNVCILMLGHNDDWHQLSRVQGLMRSSTLQDSLTAPDVWIEQCDLVWIMRYESASL